MRVEELGEFLEGVEEFDEVGGFALADARADVEGAGGGVGAVEERGERRVEFGNEVGRGFLGGQCPARPALRLGRPLLLRDEHAAVVMVMVMVMRGDG